MASPALSPNESQLTVRIVDGTRQTFSDKKPILYTVFDGNQKERFRQDENSATINFKLPFFNNFGDNYRVIASADGYFDAGYFPVALNHTHASQLDIMLLPKNNSFNFANARWDMVKDSLPFLSNGVSDDEACNRYSALMENKPKPLAALLNITTAMRQIFLSGSDTPLSYIKQIIWDDTLAQDRFFAYADAKLINQVRAAAQRGLFAVEPGAALFSSGRNSELEADSFWPGRCTAHFSRESD